jgi:hypothetical protein
MSVEKWEVVSLSPWLIQVGANSLLATLLRLYLTFLRSERAGIEPKAGRAELPSPSPRYWLHLPKPRAHSLRLQEAMCAL